jgi:hypothetical protein
VVIADRHDVDAGLAQAAQEGRIEGEDEPVRVLAEGFDGWPLEVDEGQVGVSE